MRLDTIQRRHICTGTGLAAAPHLHRDWALPAPHLHRDRTRRCHRQWTTAPRNPLRATPPAHVYVTALRKQGTLQGWSTLAFGMHRSFLPPSLMHAREQSAPRRGGARLRAPDRKARQARSCGEAGGEGGQRSFEGRQRQGPYEYRWYHSDRYHCQRNSAGGSRRCKGGRGSVQGDGAALSAPMARAAHTAL